MTDLSPLWYWINEREQIRIRKERGDPQPWTNDPILETYRFCNVRREDDLVTRWIRKNIREPFAGHPYLWLMLCIARAINWPPTLHHLIEDGTWPSSLYNYNPCPAITESLRHLANRGGKVYTGAYMISASPIAGFSKHEYVAEHVLQPLWQRRDEFEYWSDATLQDTHRKIMRSNGWGPFMAYQAVVDMRFTRLLQSAPDVMTWAAAGPGTIRGLNRLHNRPLKQALSQTQALKEMNDIYAIAPAETDVVMDFSDIPNALCETDKYLRVKLGQGRPRALYVPGRES